MNGKRVRRSLVHNLTKSARENAVEMAMNLFPTPESLAKIPKLLQTYNRQNRHTHNQIATISANQIEDTKQAITLMESADHSIQNIRGSLSAVNSLGHRSRSLILCYELTEKVNETLNNVTKTHEWLKRLLTIKDVVINLKKVLEYENNLLDFDATPIDYESDEEEFTLIEVQHRIHQLTEFRTEAMTELDSSPQNLKTFEKFFKVVGNIEDQFNKVIRSYMKELLGEFIHTI